MKCLLINPEPVSVPRPCPDVAGLAASFGCFEVDFAGSSLQRDVC